jgi:hypothetical protein
VTEDEELPEPSQPDPWAAHLPAQELAPAYLVSRFAAQYRMIVEVLLEAQDGSLTGMSFNEVLTRVRSHLAGRLSAEVAGNGYADGKCLAARTVGFDCSGLTMHAWHQATGGAVQLAHHAATQWTQARHEPERQLRAGDLVFFATNPTDPGTIHHVGIYVSSGAMIHAPRTGKAIRLENFDQSNYWESQFVGGVRPV